MHLIVDGYNVMHTLSPGREWPGRTFQERRRGFVARLAAYAGGRSHRVTVVFDGARGGDEQGGFERLGAVEVLYSARGEEADDVIRRLVDGAGQATEVLLVTSDRSLAGYARTSGASIARADELVHRLAEPAPPRAPSPGALFETRVKGVLPPPRRRAAPRSRSPLRLW